MPIFVVRIPRGALMATQPSDCSEHESLDGESILPGFNLPLAQVFHSLDLDLDAEES